MEVADDDLAEKVQALSDIELAVLLCLITDQHCIIQSEKNLMDGIGQELRLIASKVFGLTSALLECSANTTVDDFGVGILVREDGDDYFSTRHSHSKGEFSAPSSSPRLSDRRMSKSPRPFSQLDSRRIANVVIAKNLNNASQQVQIQALELMRGKRNYTRTAVHAAPKPFLLVALQESGSVRLATHLNDQFCISHTHREEDGLPNVQDALEKERIGQDDDSTSSVVHSPPEKFEKRDSLSLVFPQEDLAHLSAVIDKVEINSEVRAYLHNIVVFMRLHRAVAGGVSAMATRHFGILSHALAPLHGISFVTPSLVALAARKIYPHRIVITSPEDERSMQWGSSLDAVKAVLEGVTTEDVVEEVLQSVEAPL